MKQPNYNYQTGLINSVIENFNNGNTTVVLAAAPSAGKTRMALEIRKQLGVRTLALAHRQNLIKEQWRDASKEGYVIEPSFLGKVKRRKKLEQELKNDFVIALPQTIDSYMKNPLSDVDFDFLIVDEAHEGFLQSQVQNIIKVIKPKFILLLTGSPHEYINKKGFTVVGISAQELLDYGVISDPTIKILESSYNLKLSDYNQNMEVKEKVEFSNKSTQQTLNASLKHLNKNFKAIGKTLVVCHDQAQAVDAHTYLDHIGINSVLSISNISDGTIELEMFKNTDIQFFIVVQRGIIGFDYADLENVIDISASLNPYRLFQMLCRLVRRSDKPKTFLKITDNDLAVPTYLMMNVVVALSHPQYYFSAFSKRYTKIPVNPNFNPMKFDLSSAEIFNIGKIRNLSDLAFTTFYKVRRKIHDGEINFFEIREIAKHFKRRIDFKRAHPGLYNKLQSANMLSLLDEVLPRESPVLSWETRSLKDNLEIIEGIIKKEGFKNRYQFRMVHSGAFKYLLRKKALNKISLKPTLTKWTLKSALKESKKYNSHRGFSKGSPGAYEFLARHNAVPKWHEKNNRKWTHKTVLMAANKCKNIRELKIKHYNAYIYWRNNESTLHIPHFKPHFNKRKKARAGKHSVRIPN